MEQEKLTQDEIIKFVINKVNTDAEFKSFPRMGIARGLDTELLLGEIDLNGLTKDEQLENKVYPLFKEFISARHGYIAFNFKCKYINFAEYLPFGKLANDVKSLDKCFDELTDEEHLQIWTYKTIIECLKSTVYRILLPPEPKLSLADYLNDVESKLFYFDYKADIEEYFKSVISSRPDISTIRIIDKLKVEVEKIIKLGVIATELNGNINQLIENAMNERIRIVSDISFGLEWYDLNKPTIKDTLILCQWEGNKDYELFIKKLLLIDSYEKEFLNKSYPNFDERAKNAQIRRDRESDEKLNNKTELTKKTINERIVRDLTNRISERETANLIHSIHILFDTLKLPNIIPINSIKELKRGDLRALYYNIWLKYDVDLEIKLDQMKLAEYIKKQFPIMFISNEITTIKSHMKNGGKIIKVKDII